MGTIDLTESDRAILRVLADTAISLSSIADSVETKPAVLRDRLEKMEAVGLIRERESERYELTENGRRVLDAPGDGSADNRIDTPPAVEREIESFDIPPDQKAAVRNAFVFIAHHSPTSENAITGAIYSEHPAGYESIEVWWNQGIEKYLKKLPGIESPTKGDRWQYRDEASSCE